MPVRPIATFFADDPFAGNVHSNELFIEWKAQNAQLLERLATSSQQDMYSECVKLSYVVAGLQSALKGVFMVNAEMSAVADEALLQWEGTHTDKVEVANILQLHLEKQTSALARGRAKAVDKRKAMAAERKDRLTRAIADLFDKPEKPGWIWSNPEIVTFLKTKGGFGRFYAVEAAVKKEAAKHRKDKKEELARKYLNR